MCKHTVCPGCPSRRFAPPRLHQLAPGSNRCAQVLRCLRSDGLDDVGPISQRIPLPQQGQAYTGDGGVAGRGALFRMAAVWPPLSPPSTVRSRHDNVPAPTSTPLLRLESVNRFGPSLAFLGRPPFPTGPGVCAQLPPRCSWSPTTPPFVSSMTSQASLSEMLRNAPPTTTILFKSGGAHT